ncbi:MAG: NAD+ synthase [Phycisphaeraceae bacterium]|nr:NAD+ synthase [Phycisphaeraceae bacterium]
MRTALCQINPTVGDLAGNAAKIAGFAASARAGGADLAVFPELCLCGYPPKDLLLQEGFIDACVRQARALGAEHSAGITLVFGAPMPVDARPGSDRKGIANCLLAYRDGELLAYHDKRLLPTYDVFDEDRYFVPGNRAVVIDVAGQRVGLSICEDLWRGQDVGFAERYLECPDPVEALVKAGAGVIVNPSASPFVLGKGRRHREILTGHARRHGVYIAAVNQVGGNDELVFDGHAAAFGPDGGLIGAARGFVEEVLFVDLPVGPASRGAAVADPLTGAAEEELLYDAIVLGVRDYLRKTGFRQAVLGLSGGIDSAVTGVIAAAAVGARNVLGVSMPSRYSSEGSVSDAAALVENLGISHLSVPIEGPFAAFEGALAPAFEGLPAGVAEENLQSRVRGTILMSLSNKLGHLLLTTGNKSELAVGYCTLYGDMNGGLAVLADVGKQWVYRLARWMNQNPARLGIAGLSVPPIPPASISKPPSAELRPNQTDQDSLPPYEVLDQIIERYIERRESAARIIRETGFDPAVVSRVLRMIDLSEYKRKQVAPGLKVTGVAFGSGRRMPIAQGYRADRV